MINQVDEEEDEPCQNSNLGQMRTQLDGSCWRPKQKVADWCHDVCSGHSSACWRWTRSCRWCCWRRVDDEQLSRDVQRWRRSGRRRAPARGGAKASAHRRPTAASASRRRRAAHRRRRRARRDSIGRSGCPSRRARGAAATWSSERVRGGWWRSGDRPNFRRDKRRTTASERADDVRGGGRWRDDEFLGERDGRRPPTLIITWLWLQWAAAAS